MRMERAHRFVNQLKISSNVILAIAFPLVGNGMTEIRNDFFFSLFKKLFYTCIFMLVISLPAMVMTIVQTGEPLVILDELLIMNDT